MNHNFLVTCYPLINNNNNNNNNNNQVNMIHHHYCDFHLKWSLSFFAIEKKKEKRT